MCVYEVIPIFSFLYTLIHFKNKIKLQIIVNIVDIFSDFQLGENNLNSGYQHLDWSISLLVHQVT